MSTIYRDVNRKVGAGDVVISVAEIFDRLQGRVDTNTLDQLLSDIISGRRNQVRPGELITAELMNQILAQLESLETRVIKLEAGSTGGGTGGTPAIGNIDVRYKSSARGIQIVPGDPVLYPHTFTLANNTNTTLPINVTAAVSAPRGDWSTSAQVSSSESPLASGATRDFTVSIRVPSNAVIGDVAVLTVIATVGSPHNKISQRELAMTVAASPTGPVERSVSFTRILQPETTDVQPSTPSNVFVLYVFDLRYAAVSAPLSGNFSLTVTMTATPAETLNDWAIDFVGTPRNVPSPPVPGVVFTTLPLDSASATAGRVTVRIRTPRARGTVPKNVSFTVRVEAIDISGVEPLTEGPFTLRLPTS